MDYTKHISNTRGQNDYGWLKSHYTFSFAHYYDPNRMGFGALRVINDDIVAPARGFDTHPHNNMEIISIPLKGSLEHKDTIGNEHIIQKGEVQIMSAGSGISHSEYNHSVNSEVNFLQIWVQPKELNISPRYAQAQYLEHSKQNKLQLLVSPDGRDHSVLINQDAYFSYLPINSNHSLSYKKYHEENGVYFFLIDGNIKIDHYDLNPRDGLAVEGVDQIDISALSQGELLIIEVPINI